jgi:hypothetical protein
MDAVARERAHRWLELTVNPVAHHVEHHAPLELRPDVELCEQARGHAVADSQLAVVRDLLAGQQADEMGLARAVGAD